MQGTAQPKLGGRASTVEAQGSVCEEGARVGWGCGEMSLGVGAEPCRNNISLVCAQFPSCIYAFNLLQGRF